MQFISIGVPSQNFNDKIDGFDMSGIIRSSLPSPRNSILYELFAPGVILINNH